VWQALRSELHPKGFELVTVGLGTGAEARLATVPGVVIAEG